MQKNRKALTAKILTKVFIIIALACAVLLIRQYMMMIHASRTEKRMLDLFPAAKAEEAQSAIVDIPRMTPRDIFHDLLEVNPDVVGWLQVGESINTAVVQKDNSYYLTHNLFRENAAEGMPFMDKDCFINTDDEHLLIHGHNMKNGLVFGTLKDFRSEEYLKQYPYITFNSLYEDHTYVIFAVFDISTEPDNSEFVDMQQFNFESDDEFNAFVGEARRRSIYDIPVDVIPGDRLLSLATCSYDYDNGRLIIMGRALRPDETVDSMP